ncbi:multi anti extrusion protein MatE [Catenovulum agarivorans DS-2]|uniref:Multidrug-efflux transporter n=1 Tax=Catenovulum agarivorans DS-2 TaxID=1328313 RepID=W7QTC9_9ALTE|nr:multi anti extrusion protein MatE [Catenovulum agarivorans DS-2]
MQNPYRRLIKLAWPIWITQAIQTLMVTIDLVMSAQVSDADMAAVGTALSIWHPVFFFALGCMMVLAPLLSRSYGSSNNKAFQHDLNQSLWFALLVAIIFTVCLFAAMPLLSLLSLDKPLVEIGQQYLTYLALGIPFICFIGAFRYLNESLGQTKPLMYISIFGLLCNIPLNYLFIYGSAITPKMGGAGCGIATTIVNIIVLVSLYIFSKYSRHTQQFAKNLRFEKIEIATQLKLIRLGCPIGLTLFLEIALFAAVALAIATHGTNAAAAHQIALNVVTNFYMIPLSIGMAATVLIGQSIGKNDQYSAKSWVKYTLIVSIAFSVLSTTTIILFRSVFASMFEPSQQVFQLAIALLVWAGIFQLPDVIQTSFSSCLRGYADTQVPFVLVLVSYWLLGFPLGMILSETNWIIPQQGPEGYWQGLLIGLSCTSILLYLRLKRVWNHQI